MRVGCFPMPQRPIAPFEPLPRGTVLRRKKEEGYFGDVMVTDWEGDNEIVLFRPYPTLENDEPSACADALRIHYNFVRVMYDIVTDNQGQPIQVANHQKR